MRLPWSHIQIFQGIEYLKKEFALAQEDVKNLEPSQKTMDVPDDWRPAGKRPKRK